MFGRKDSPDADQSRTTELRRDEHSHDTRDGQRRSVAVARGGVSLGAVLTGVVVAFGALFLLSAIVGGILAATGVDADSVQGQTQEVTVGVGISIVVAWLLACLWGGYTAGRMGRGAGAGNGLLVPVAVIIIGVIVIGIVNVLGATANLNLPFTANYQLPTENNNLVDLGIGFGIGTLVAMLLGGLLGGMLGSRWHTKLERRTIAAEEERAEQRREEHARDEDRRRDEHAREDETRRREQAAETRTAAAPAPAPGATSGERDSRLDEARREAEAKRTGAPRATGSPGSTGERTDTGATGTSAPPTEEVRRDPTTPTERRR